MEQPVKSVVSLSPHCSVPQESYKGGLSSRVAAPISFNFLGRRTSPSTFSTWWTVADVILPDCGCGRSILSGSSSQEGAPIYASPTPKHTALEQPGRSEFPIFPSSHSTLQRFCSGEVQQASQTSKPCPWTSGSILIASDYGAIYITGHCQKQ